MEERPFEGRAIHWPSFAGPQAFKGLAKRKACEPAATTFNPNLMQNPVTLAFTPTACKTPVTFAFAPTACQTVEERPFEGRVKERNQPGFSPSGRVSPQIVGSFGRGLGIPSAIPSPEVRGRFHSGSAKWTFPQRLVTSDLAHELPNRRSSLKRRRWAGRAIVPFWEQLPTVPAAKFFETKILPASG